MAKKTEKKEEKKVKGVENLPVSEIVNINGEDKIKTTFADKSVRIQFV